MKRMPYLFFVFAFLLIAGCATTGRNYQTDIDALNSKLSAMQGQISAKDEEIARLESRLREAEAERDRIESEKDKLSEKIEGMKRPNTSSAPDSDLK
ncbi:MAG: hypothetical protein HY592_02250 [Candidatus Omnitrophica bacterium]|nr:hypothetical protein [Candidatus Omnitrophota bacterium]